MTAPQTAPPSLDDFLLGGTESRKGRSLSFKQMGTTHTGTICGAPEVRQQRDPDSGDPKTWDNGDPMWQIVVPLQTTLRSQEIEDDDGVRFLYVSGSKKPESRSMHVAVADAVRQAGASGLEVGGQLTITYTADGPKRPGASAVSNPPKQYSASYVPAANAALMSQPDQQQATPATHAQPGHHQAAPATHAQPGHHQAAGSGGSETGGNAELEAALANMPAEQAAAMRAAGLTLEQLKAMNLV